MTPMDFRHRERLRVRWSEIDAQKIVFNGHYLTYFDTAVTGYWRAMALPYASTMAALGGDLYVRKATLDYRASARHDDVLEVGMRCARIGTSSIGFEGAVFRQGELLVGGELVYVFADPSTQTSRPVPPRLRAALDAFEAGEPMTTLHVGDLPALGAEAARLRADVFVGEQRIAAALGADGDDAAAYHVVLRNRFDVPVATGQLLHEAPGVTRIGRMAVAQALRGSGLGRAVVDALLAEALCRGAVEVVLHAQGGVEPFYRRAGFTTRGAVFDAAGRPHVEMTRRLAGPPAQGTRPLTSG